MHRVYFNPNWDPEFYYPLLKPLLIFYDQVFVWNVSNVHLERHCDPDVAGFLDFIENSQTNDPFPAMTPVGRESWFDEISRANMPRGSIARLSDGRFISRMRAFAERHTHDGATGILHNSDRAVPLEVLDRAWNEDPDTLRTCARRAAPHFHERYVEQSILPVAEQYKFEKERAIINAYFQDVQAMQQIGCAAPIVKLGLIPGFQAANWSRELKDRIELPQERELAREGWAPSMTMGVTPDELVKVIQKINSAKDFTWAQVLEYRRSEKASHLRSYLRSHASKVRPDFGETLSGLIEKDAREQNKSVDNWKRAAIAAGGSLLSAGMTQIASTGPAISVGAGFGVFAFLASEHGKGFANLFLDILGLESRVHPYFSKLVLRGDKRILLDSPYMKPPVS